MAIPSLAMIPSGYKDGKVYSVLPSNGDGDFTFSRGSNATRVNKDGLIEIMPLELGEELVTNGSFATDSDWTSVNNAGTDTGIESGYLRIETDGAFTQASQNDVTTSGKKYKLVYTILNSDNGSLGLITDGNITSLIPSSVGTHIYYFTAHSTSFVLKRYSGTLNVEIDNVSVKEVLSGYDLPRLDYSDSSCPSLLLEPQSTNLIEYSEDFSQWSIFDNTTTQANYGITPDGTQNSFKIASSGAVNDFIYKSLSITPITNYTISFFIKNIDSQQTEFFNPSQNKIIINWNGSNIQSITSGATYESFGNDWYRITATSQSLSGGSLVVRFYPSTLSASSIELFGYQLEQGSYPTSYIPTQGSAVTRLGEISVTQTPPSGIINSSEGVFYAEMSALSNDGANRYISLSNGSTSNRVVLRFNSSNEISGFVVSGTTQASFSYDVNILNKNKVALKWKQNDFALWVNGIEVGTDTSGVPPINLSLLRFEDGADNGQYFYGKLKEIKIYNTVLTDQELASLTS